MDPRENVLGHLRERAEAKVEAKLGAKAAVLTVYGKHSPEPKLCSDAVYLFHERRLSAASLEQWAQRKRFNYTLQDDY